MMEFSSIIIYVFGMIRFYFDVLLCPTWNEKQWYTKWKFNVPNSNNKVKKQISTRYTLLSHLGKSLVQLYFIMDLWFLYFFLAHSKIPYGLTLDQSLTWA